MNRKHRCFTDSKRRVKILSQSTNFGLFDDDINLKGLFDIISPENNLVLADDMMLSDAQGIILRVSETYEKNFGFAHDSIVGKSAFDLKRTAPFPPASQRRSFGRRKRSPPPRPSTVSTKTS